MSLTLQDFSVVHSNTYSRDTLEVNENASEISLLQTSGRGESARECCLLKTQNRLYRLQQQDVESADYTLLASRAQRRQFLHLQSCKPVFARVSGTLSLLECVMQTVRVVSVHERGKVLSWSLNDDQGGGVTEVQGSPSHISSPGSLAVRYKAVLEQAYGGEQWQFCGEPAFVEICQVKHILLLTTLGHVIVLQLSESSISLVEVILAGPAEVCCLSRHPCPAQLSAFSAVTVSEGSVVLGDVFGYVHVLQDLRPCWRGLWPGYALNQLNRDSVLSHLVTPDLCPCSLCSASQVDLDPLRTLLVGLQDTKVNNKPIGFQNVVTISLSLGISDIKAHNGFIYICSIKGDLAVLPASPDTLYQADKATLKKFQLAEHVVHTTAMQSMTENKDPMRLQMLQQLANIPVMQYPLLLLQDQVETNIVGNVSCMTVFNEYLLCGTLDGRVIACSLASETTPLKLQGVILEYSQFTSLQHTNLYGTSGSAETIPLRALPTTCITALPHHSDAPSHGQPHPAVPSHWAIQYGHIPTAFFCGTTLQHTTEFPSLPAYPHLTSVQQSVVEKFTDPLISDRTYLTPCIRSSLYTVVGAQVYRLSFPAALLYQYSAASTYDVITNSITHSLQQLWVLPVIFDGTTATTLNRAIAPSYSITVPDTYIEQSASQQLHLQCVYKPSIKNPLYPSPYETSFDISAAFQAFPAYEQYSVQEAVFFSQEDITSEYSIEIMSTSMVLNGAVTSSSSPSHKLHACAFPDNIKDAAIYRMHGKSIPLRDTVVMGFHSDDALHSSTRSYLPASKAHKAVDSSLLSQQQYLEYNTQLKPALLTEALQKGRFSNYLPQLPEAPTKRILFTGLQKLHNGTIILQDKTHFYAQDYIPVFYSYCSRTEVQFVFVHYQTGELQCGVYNQTEQLSLVFTITTDAPTLSLGSSTQDLALPVPAFCVSVTASLALFHCAGLFCIAHITERSVQEFTLQFSDVCAAELVEMSSIYIVLRNKDDFIVMKVQDDQLTTKLTSSSLPFAPIISFVLVDSGDSVSALLLLSSTQNCLIISESYTSPSIPLGNTQTHWLSMDPTPSLHTVLAPSKVLPECKLANTQFLSSSDSAKQPQFLLTNLFCAKYSVCTFDSQPRLQPMLLDVRQVLSGAAHASLLQQTNSEGLPAYAAFPVYSHSSPYAVHYVAPPAKTGPRAGMQTKTKTGSSQRLPNLFAEVLSLIATNEVSHVNILFAADTVSVSVTSLAFPGFMMNPAPPQPAVDARALSPELTLLGSVLSYSSPQVCTTVGAIMEQRVEKLSKQNLIKYLSFSPLICQVQCNFDSTAMQMNILAHVHQPFSIVVSTPSAKLLFPPPFNLNHSFPTTETAQLIASNVSTSNAMQTWVRLLFVVSMPTSQRHVLANALTNDIIDIFHKSFIDSYIAVSQMFGSLCNVVFTLSSDIVAVAKELATESALLSIFISLLANSPKLDVLHRVFEFLQSVVPQDPVIAPSRPALERICALKQLPPRHPQLSMLKRCQQRFSERFLTQSLADQSAMRYITEIARFSDTSTSFFLLSEFARVLASSEQGNFLHQYYLRCFGAQQRVCQELYMHTLECQQQQEEMVILSYVPNPLVDSLMSSTGSNLVTTAHIALPNGYYPMSHFTHVCTTDPLNTPSIVPKARTLVISHCEQAHVQHAAEHLAGVDQHDQRHHCECSRQIDETAVRAGSALSNSLAQVLRSVNIAVDDKPYVLHHEYTLQFPNSDPSNAVLARHEAMGTTETYCTLLHAYTSSHSSVLCSLLHLITLLNRHTSAFKLYEAHLGPHYSNCMASQVQQLCQWLLQVMHCLGSQTAPPLVPILDPVDLRSSTMTTVYDYIRHKSKEERVNDQAAILSILSSLDAQTIDPLDSSPPPLFHATPLDATSLIELDTLDDHVQLFGTMPSEQLEDLLLPIASAWKTMRSKNSKHTQTQQEEIASANITVENLPLYISAIQNKQYPLAYYMGDINITAASNLERAVLMQRQHHIERLESTDPELHAPADQQAFHQATALLDSYRNKILPTIAIGRLTLLNIPVAHFVAANLLAQLQDTLRYQKNFLLKMNDIEGGAPVREDWYLPE